MKPFLFFLLLLSTAFSQNLPPDPPREVRAAWVATVWNIDWPSKPGLPASTQKSQLLAILDRAASLNLNAVILQVRPAGDALYQTDLEPWSSVLSGTEGRSPGYDPLAFAVAEAHRRGLELHAWFNPFRPATAAGKSHPSNHVTRRFPDAVRTYRKKPWMDPGDPRVRAHTIKVITDVARRYDVDGVHIDDYFYPYPSAGQKTDFPDSATYARYGRGKNRDAWRRSNTDTFVRDLYSAIKKTRPHVKFGISPFGIWRPGNPRGIEAKLDSFAHIHADSRRWLNEGWCDYFSPQLYWRIEPRKQSFTALTGWWNSENKKRRHLPRLLQRRPRPPRLRNHQPDQRHPLPHQPFRPRPHPLVVHTAKTEPVRRRRPHPPPALPHQIPRPRLPMARQNQTPRPYSPPHSGNHIHLVPCPTRHPLVGRPDPQQRPLATRRHSPRLPDQHHPEIRTARPGHPPRRLLRQLLETRRPQQALADAP